MSARVMRAIALLLLALGLSQPAPAQFDAAARGLAVQAKTSAAAVRAAVPKTWYLGQIATRSYVPNNFSGALQNTASSLTGKSIAYVRQALTQVQVVYGNWAVLTPSSTSGSATTSGIEKASDVALTLSNVTMEYPVGTVVCTFTWSGSSSYAFSAGVMASPISDVCSGLNIPSGAMVAFNATFSHASQSASGKDAFPFTRVTAGTVEDTANGETTARDGVVIANANVFPLAVVSITKQPSAGFIGDSRCIGQGGDVSLGGDTGELAPSIGPTYGYISMCIPSDQAQWFRANHTMRLPLLAYVSDDYYQLGINDLNGGARTAAQLKADDAAIISGLGKPVFVTTIAPITSFANEAARVSVNKARHTGYAGTVATFDTALVVQTAQDSGVWQANYTADGIHETPAGYAAIKASGAIDLTMVGR